MPHKLKSSVRRSRRNKKLFAVGFVAVLVVIVGAVFAFGQLGSTNNNSNNNSNDDNTGTNEPLKVLLQTSMGNITIQLRDDKPITTGNFRSLVEQGAYDNTIFHRVIKDFMIQGGQLNQAVSAIDDEIGTNNHNVKGTIAMAKTSAPNSATSQFFINVVDNSNLYATFDTTYTVFGNVIEGMDVAEAISNVGTDSSDKPLTDVILIKAEILP